MQSKALGSETLSQVYPLYTRNLGSHILQGWHPCGASKLFENRGRESCESLRRALDSILSGPGAQLKVYVAVTAFGETGKGIRPSGRGRLLVKY